LEDIVKIYLKSVGCALVDWNKLVEDRVQCRAFVSTVMILGVP